MSSTSSQELAVLRLGSSEAECGLPPSARSAPTAAKSSSDTGPASLNTMTFGRSVLNASGETELQSMPSPAASPAKTLATPDLVPDLPASDPVFGLSMPGSLASWDRTSLSWRTSQRCLIEGLGEVLGTLSDLGFNAIWDTVTACAVGLTHMRRRVFIVAYANRLNGWARFRDSFAREYRALQTIDRFESSRARQRARLANPSELYGGADGLPFGMERNRGIGNAVSPDVAELIGRAIMASISPQEKRDAG